MHVLAYPNNVLINTHSLLISFVHIQCVYTVCTASLHLFLYLFLYMGTISQVLINLVNQTGREKVEDMIIHYNNAIMMMQHLLCVVRCCLKPMRSTLFTWTALPSPM